jgi:hypothetical protein
MTGEFVRNAGLGMLGAGIGLMFVGMDWEAGLEASPVSWLGIPVMVGGMLLNFRGRRVAAHAVASSATSPLRDSRPDVLYLRAFDSDAAGMKRSIRGGLSTAEEDLAAALQPFGDLVGIGRPGEPLPLPGATRMYTSDHEWQGVVRDEMRRASLVVIRVGGGAGLQWECQEAFKTLRPEQLVLLVLDISMQEYRHFVRTMQATLGVRLPDIPPCELVRMAIDVRQNPNRATPGFIRFTHGWRAQFLALPYSLQLGYRDLVKPFREALRPVFEARGVPWAAGARWTQ